MNDNSSSSEQISIIFSISSHFFLESKNDEIGNCLLGFASPFEPSDNFETLLDAMTFWTTFSLRFTLSLSDLWANAS